MYSGKTAWSLFFLLCWAAMGAQESSVYSDAQAAYKRGVEYYDNGLPAKARREFQQTLDLLLPVNEAEAKMLRTRAQLFIGKCSVVMKTRDGEMKALEFIRNIRPDPEYKLALADLGDHYFNSRRYDEALRYYDQIPAVGLPKKQMEQIRFRQGYAHFSQKRYPEAKGNLQALQNEPASAYFAPANYYLGFCFFQEGNYEQAYKCMTAVENDPAYKQEMPYIQGQILFAQRRFQDVVNKLRTRANDPRVSNRKEINQLVGQSLFEQGNYKEALPFLEYYAANSSRLREEELYQLGFAQYQEKKYPAAIGNLRPLSTANSLIGQNAMFYLANCYLQTGDKNGALNALATAKRQNFDPALQEEAMINYAKIAYELNMPREAANELKNIKPNSKYYNEAQALIGDVLLSYKDYRQAFEIADELAKTNRTPQFLAVYQKMAFNRGIQLLQENNPDGAKTYLQKAMEYPADPKIQASAIYWMGDLANRKGQFKESISYFDQFLTLARALSNLPDESGIFTAQYIQGYNYLKTGSYDQSRTAFQATVDGINRNARFIKNTDITVKVLGDATLRLGDSYFRTNQYGNASQYYKAAIEKRYAGYDYAIFQNALIDGLQGRRTDETLALEQLARDFPKSEYADDALFRLGAAYQAANRPAQALESLRTLVTRYSNSPLINQAYLQLGLISYNMTNYDDAISYYKRVFTNNPDTEEANQALQTLEYIYVETLSRPEEFVAFIETVPGYKIENADRDALAFKAAQSLFEKNDFPRAVESFTSYLRSFPKGVNVIAAYYGRAESYAALKDYSKALSDYEAVIAPGSGRNYIKALDKASVIAYNHELDFAKAFKLYTELEKAATNDGMLFNAQLGALRSAYRSKNQNAVYNYADKVTKNPKAGNPEIATANFFLGKLAFDKQDFANALPALDKVIRLSQTEQSDEALYLRAFIHYRQRDLNKALESCLESIENNSGFYYWRAKTSLLLADVLADKGSKEDLLNAQAVLEALLENYREDQEIVNQATIRLGQIRRLNEQNSILNKNGGN
ncbi:MAG: tetratricopeptide repeat protein [Saprospiraceae bacterium]|jgi:tetratricopeptide (TPR) repeat protein